MSEHLYEQAKKAVDALFSDTSVPQGQTWTDLNTLRDEIANMMETLDGSDWGEEQERE